MLAEAPGVGAGADVGSEASTRGGAVVSGAAVVWSALAAVVLWEAARRLFGAVLLDTPAYGEVTGTLAGVVAVLLWIYAGVAVTLYAAELAAVLNGNRVPSEADVS